MAAAATADDTPPPPPPVVACSNARMKEWLRERGFDDNLNPNSIRALGHGGSIVWHYAVQDARIDVLEWLKAAGLLDMINQANDLGFTPLHWAMNSQSREAAARWMMSHGADTSAISNHGTTVFEMAKQYMSASFVEELAGTGAARPPHIGNQ